jgi:hypothetical protein
MGLRMNDWQVLQIFLSETGVHEVEMNSDGKSLRCNCPGSERRSQCKHMRFVRVKMNRNGGIYPCDLSNRANKLDAIAASQDPKVFRQLLIDYGKIEVV